MAVLAGIYGKTEPIYEGCVVDTYEHNGYHDSYWYAKCWDREKKEIVEIEYDTTACGGGGWAKIDATSEVLKEMYRTYKKKTTAYFDNVWNVKMAKEVQKGDWAIVMRGRKVKKGTVGEVFWIGKTYNYYSRQSEDRVGLKVGEEKVFLPLEYVERLDWQNYLIHGKQRKEMIRRATIDKMPVHYQKYFA